MFIACVLVVGLVHHGFAAVIKASSATTCEYKGQTYQAGQSFHPDPCSPCFCSTTGQVACAVMDCAPAMCVDAVKKPDQCCATCPNGANCKHGSHIIKAGETYQPDSSTWCRCPHDPFSFGFGTHSLQAVCAMA